MKLQEFDMITRRQLQECDKTSMAAMKKSQKYNLTQTERAIAIYIYLQQ